MDLVSNRTIDITTLAMDGLMKKHKVLSVNIANAEVKGYKRQDVSFEGKLQKILELEDEQEQLKISNSSTSTGNAAFFGGANLSSMATNKAIEASRAYASFKPTTMKDDSPIIAEDGNNVNIEKEMVELAKNSTKFKVLTELQSRMMKHTDEIIKGTR